jgi:UTP--glucose-1-phosphate uridylyltransferase
MIRKQTITTFKRVKKAVLPAAGKGTRFLPATKAIPKEMLPIADKPLIQYAAEEAVASGVETLVIVTGRGKAVIEDHFDFNLELEHELAGKGKKDLEKMIREIADMVRVCYTRQKEPLGLGHAVLMAREMVGEEPFAVMLPDDIIASQVPCLEQLLRVYRATGGAVVAAQEVPLEKVSAYGIFVAEPVKDRQWKGRLYRVHDVVEKPKPKEAPSRLAVIGRYVLLPEIFDFLEETCAGAGGEIQLTDGMRELAHRRPMYAYVFEGSRYDAGDKLGFLQATIEMALQNPELGPRFREYLRGLSSLRRR